MYTGGGVGAMHSLSAFEQKLYIMVLASITAVHFVLVILVLVVIMISRPIYNKIIYEGGGFLKKKYI